MINRRKTRQISVGDVKIGGDAPIVVQSMTTTHPKDIEATINQIRCLEDVGCHIVRVAIPDESAIRAIPVIKKGIKIPLRGFLLVILGSLFSWVLDFVFSLFAN